MSDKKRLTTNANTSKRKLWAVAWDGPALSSVCRDLERYL